MTTVTLSIEQGALPERFPAELAISLGIACVDHRRLEREIAERSDTGDGTMHRIVDGCRLLPRSWHATSRQLAARMREEIIETAARGNVLIVGWAAAAVLRSLPHVARIRVTAPMALREQSIMRRLAYSDAETARIEISSADAQVARFMRRMFDVDWPDADLFDVILNADGCSDMRCAELIRLVVQCPRYVETEAAKAELAAELEALHRIDLEHERRTFQGAPVVSIGPDTVALAGVGSHEEAIARVEQHLHGHPTGESEPQSRAQWDPRWWLPR